MLLLIATYAIRIFEYPAMARQSLYFWDQCWLVREPAPQPGATQSSSRESSRDNPLGPRSRTTSARTRPSSIAQTRWESVLARTAALAKTAARCHSLRALGGSTLSATEQRAK